MKENFKVLAPEVSQTKLSTTGWENYRTNFLGKLTVSNPLINNQIGALVLRSPPLPIIAPERQLASNIGFRFTYTAPLEAELSEEFQLEGPARDLKAARGATLRSVLTIADGKNPVTVHCSFRPVKQPTLKGLTDSLAEFRVEFRRMEQKLYLVDHDEKFADDGIKRIRVRFGKLHDLKGFADNYTDANTRTAYCYRQYEAIEGDQSWFALYIRAVDRTFAVVFELPASDIHGCTDVFLRRVLVPLSFRG